MAARETENSAYANFGVTNKEHYGMLWCFLKWAIRYSQKIGLELPKTLSSFHQLEAGMNSQQITDFKEAQSNSTFSLKLKTYLS